MKNIILIILKSIIINHLFNQVNFIYQKNKYKKTLVNFLKKILLYVIHYHMEQDQDIHLLLNNHKNQIPVKYSHQLF
jgi:hypothetical protein